MATHYGWFTRCTGERWTVAIPLPAQPEHLNFRPINEMSTEALQVSVGMDVFVLGYPFGFQLPGYPVWKRGSIASEPDLAPLTYRYMLVDSASRPGMSYMASSFEPNPFGGTAISTKLGNSRSF